MTAWYKDKNAVRCIREVYTAIRTGDYSQVAPKGKEVLTPHMPTRLSIRWQDLYGEYITAIQLLEKRNTIRKNPNGFLEFVDQTHYGRN